MKEIEIEPILVDPKAQDDNWVMKAPCKEDYDFYEADKNQSFVVKDKLTGRVVVAVIRGEMPKELTGLYYKAITSTGAITKTNNRGMASGQKPIKKILKDGTVSRTSRTAEEVESSIIGYFDRYPRINYCRKTAWTQAHDEELAVATAYTEQADLIYKKYIPREYEENSEVARATSPDFMLGKSIFTTITLNRNFRTHYHRDAGNLDVGLACMSYIKRGKFSGGDVVFPNYRVAAKLFNLDLVIFNNREIHGNTPIESIRGAEYERITSVFFYRRNMQFCGTAEQELERAKRNKGDQLIGPVTEDLNQGQFN